MACKKPPNKRCTKCGKLFRRYKREPTFQTEPSYKPVCPGCGAHREYIEGYCEHDT